ncbi:hypothetical protein ASPZODRAFT_60314 [Penicilliopsis zonata CBS 506.65]|uniref:Uncharacterized protein n=1 Tax=Penicilliopsis zonata CBS 506.65 TaxID=1073090 RepID=A0A1L9SPY3_9EURO|nr:hypothetical protein ASPZODRAFT_60314 [Penicilliopsis zonata CBS 506.65]OJJ49117.1 hypothetical protein ASPZODRAFT_60314 [Penicilliopsis zonata CBS 506.65]
MAYAHLHTSPAGPGDTRPTALQIIHDQDLAHRLADKVILITGCSSGLGAETARALAVTDATLFLAVRNMQKARAELADLLLPSPDVDSDDNQHSKRSRVRLLKLDLSSFASIRAGASNFLAQSKKLHILICNGGVMGTDPITDRTADGFEKQFGTNHLGHFLLFVLLKDMMLSSVSEGFQCRVVSVTSSAHRMSGIRWEDINFTNTKPDSTEGERKDSSGDGKLAALAYAQSKTANIYMMNEIERRYGPRGLHGLSVHPGEIFTGLQKFVSQELLDEWHKPEMIRFVKSVEQGAATTVLAAVGRQWEGKGGVYLEDCQEGKPVEPGYQKGDPGYAEHAFDSGNERRLWDESLLMTGILNSD